MYEFMRLEYCVTSRNAFNNRVLRLVKHDYLVRDEVPFRTEGYVYSICARGAAELAGLGEYYTGLPRRPVDGQLPKAVYHAINLNEIHLALTRSEQLVRWTSDTEIRSRNEFTDGGYKKDYDAVVTVRSDSASGPSPWNTSGPPVVTEGIIGCPHEEGLDYPEGTSCPQCPYWAGPDHFTHERIQ